jgi:hypothetical protein
MAIKRGKPRTKAGPKPKRKIIMIIDEESDLIDFDLVNFTGRTCETDPSVKFFLDAFGRKISEKNKPEYDETEEKLKEREKEAE